MQQWGVRGKGRASGNVRPARPPCALARNTPLSLPPPQVDLVFSGHVHHYERTKPMYKFKPDPCGPGARAPACNEALRRAAHRRRCASRPSNPPVPPSLTPVHISVGNGGIERPTAGNYMDQAGGRQSYCANPAASFDTWFKFGYLPSGGWLAGDGGGLGGGRGRWGGAAARGLGGTGATPVQNAAETPSTLARARPWPLACMPSTFVSPCSLSQPPTRDFCLRRHCHLRGGIWVILHHPAARMAGVARELDWPRPHDHHQLHSRLLLDEAHRRGRHPHRCRVHCA